MTLPITTAGPFASGFGTAIDALLGLSALQRMYDALPPGDFITAALERLAIDVRPAGLLRVPGDGPLIVVANHPTGALDGLAVLETLRRRRVDVRVLGNHWLTRIPEMRPWTIPVDPFAGGAARNASGLRSARRWLEGGGALVVFPAGAVARHTEVDGEPRDEPWSDGLVALARWTRAPLLPVFIGGRPGCWFRGVSRLHPLLGTLLLPRELLRQAGTTVPVRIGAPMAAARLDAFPSRAAALSYVRVRLAAESGRSEPPPRVMPVAPAVAPCRVQAQMASLPAASRLAVAGHLEVFCAQAGAVPDVLEEIGRLRELTFRAAGEGTGLASDLDRFDADYWHLILWNREQREVVGAYRMAPTVPECRRPLYTESLFQWARPPARAIGPAIELGRSFIRPEYQRHAAALPLLWRGIGAFAARFGRGRWLFGPVSISADYRPMARELMAAWLLRHARATPHGIVRPRHAVRIRREATAVIEEGRIETLADLAGPIRELEGGRGLPVLLRHYLRLNGRVLAVSRDPGFADAIDALVVVDLLGMPAGRLERYCGVEGARRLRAARADEKPYAIGSGFADRDQSDTTVRACRRRAHRSAAQ